MVACIDEVLEMLAKLVVIGVMISLDRCVFQGSVHPFDLSVGPRMVWFVEVMFDTALLPPHVEHVCY